VYLYPDATLTNDDIAQAWVVDEGHDDQLGVFIQFVADGAKKLRAASPRHAGKPLAIVLHGEVVIAPVVRSVMTDTAFINGDFTKSEAERIAAGVTAR
jgi:preprotein translocase subunit SecD